MQNLKSGLHMQNLKSGLQDRRAYVVKSWPGEDRPHNTALVKPLAETLFPANPNGAWEAGDVGTYKQLYVYTDDNFVSAITISKIDNELKKAKKTKKIYDMLAELDDCYINHPTTVLWVRVLPIVETFLGISTTCKFSTTYEISVLKYCPAGSWFDAIEKQQPNSKFTLEDSELLGLGNALAKIHAEGYAILDIKPDNIVFCNCGEKLLQASFIDLDDLRTQDETKQKIFGTPGYSVLIWMNKLQWKISITAKLLEYVDWFSMAMLVVINYELRETVLDYSLSYQAFLRGEEEKPELPKYYDDVLAHTSLTHCALKLMNFVELFPKTVPDTSGYSDNYLKILNNYLKTLNDFIALMTTSSASTNGTELALNLRW